MKRKLIFITTLLGALLGVVLVEAVYGAPLLQAPPVPHTIEAREACLDCHTTDPENTLAMPEDHAERAVDTCLACHQPPEGEGVTATAMPEPTAEAEPSATPAPTTASEPTAGTVVGTVVPAGEYEGPEFCAQCHTPHIQEWQESTHANAFEDEVFQGTWLEHQKPGYCLKCHATGYDPNTGEPVFEGVTCESCHGTYEEGHPQVMMTVDAAAERCGVCHETTYQEWQLSGHSERGVKCASCHAVHSQGLLFETATALCAGCHGDRAEDFAHASHADHAVTCADCHMYRPPDGQMSEGQMPTGHFFAVESQACTQCHTRDSIHSRRGEFDDSEDVSVHLMERITTLEEEIEEVEAGGNRNLAFGLAGGALGGLLLGALIGWLLQRRAAGGNRGAQVNP
jgi:predicted CXXCH cytochrome family protein